MSVIPALWKTRQGDLEFEGSLGIVRPRLRATTAAVTGVVDAELERPHAGNSKCGGRPHS